MRELLSFKSLFNSCSYRRHGPSETLLLFIWGKRSPLAAQSKVDSENAHWVREYESAWVTRCRWYRKVGILDPRARWISPLGSVGTPNPMGISMKGDLYAYIQTYIHTYKSDSIFDFLQIPKKDLAWYVCSIVQTKQSVIPSVYMCCHVSCCYSVMSTVHSRCDPFTNVNKTHLTLFQTHMLKMLFTLHTSPNGIHREEIWAGGKLTFSLSLIGFMVRTWWLFTTGSTIYILSCWDMVTFSTILNTQKHCHITFFSKYKCFFL